jgi:hypothetical protein
MVSSLQVSKDVIFSHSSSTDINERFGSYRFKPSGTNFGCGFF